ncbi:thiamine pyrophosphate-dependent enzyme [Nocardioides humi]|uniref:thiamine pyrophosphate-dependent enzyme n=1 Tax=Nocardioides humi TaxID=449461 RepID=UPI001C63C862|nr:thiamine pyrophosphate-dependent enzyme [Nocardioides humi]
MQFVRPDGSVTEDGARHGIDVELARTCYRDMVLARRLDHEALALQRQGELSLWLMAWGQEAAQVGSAQALRQTDMVFPSYREHAVALHRGVRPSELLAQWRGCTHGGWDVAERRFHLYSLVLGTQTLHATGYAAGARLAGSDELVVAYFGDGASSQGDVNEALNWSAAASLPLLFLCQNNQWAISTPAALQMRTSVHQRAAGFGIASFVVDGNDVLAVHAVTAAAAELVRAGKGPALVEAVTYRRAGHSSSDDPTRYRSDDEVADWTARDPIDRVDRILRASGVPADFFDDVQAEAEQLALRVREECRAIPDPDLDDVFASTYAASRLDVERELAERHRMLRSLEEVPA